MIMTMNLRTNAYHTVYQSSQDSIGKTANKKNVDTDIIIINAKTKHANNLNDVSYPTT